MLLNYGKKSARETTGQSSAGTVSPRDHPDHPLYNGGTTKKKSKVRKKSVKVGSNPAGATKPRKTSTEKLEERNQKRLEIMRRRSKKGQKLNEQHEEDPVYLINHSFGTTKGPEQLTASPVEELQVSGNRKVCNSRENKFSFKGSFCYSPIRSPRSSEQSP